MGRHASRPPARRRARLGAWRPFSGAAVAGRYLRRLAIGGALGVLVVAVLAGVELFSARPLVTPFQTARSRAAPGTAQASAPKRAAPPSAPATVAAAAAPLLRPAAGRLVRGYGWAFSRTFDDWQFHGGLDIAAPVGTPVLAAATGTVAAVGHSSLWGGMVRLRLADGRVCVYEGLGDVAVASGETVRAGQSLGAVGASPAAEATEPPHVHWEVWQNGRPVNPEPSSGSPQGTPHG